MEKASKGPKAEAPPGLSWWKQQNRRPEESRRFFYCFMEQIELFSWLTCRKTQQERPAEALEVE
jgi:hypothetical protein